MFINDDGLQMIEEEERRARIDFYTDHSIGWTARPKHGSEGFLRRGKFKKVCNSFEFILHSIVLLGLFHGNLAMSCKMRCCMGGTGGISV